MNTIWAPVEWKRDFSFAMTKSCVTVGFSAVCEVKVQHQRSSVLEWFAAARKSPGAVFKTLRTQRSFLEKRWKSCIGACITHFQGSKQCVMKRLGISGIFYTLGRKHWQAEQGHRDWEVYINEEGTTLQYGKRWWSGVEMKEKSCLGRLARKASGSTKDGRWLWGAVRTATIRKRVFADRQTPLHSRGTSIPRLENEDHLGTLWLQFAASSQYYFSVGQCKPTCSIRRKNQMICLACCI